MPRKVIVYITAPPGDGLEKSRVWFREYVKVSFSLFFAITKERLIYRFSLSLLLEQLTTK